MRSHGHMLWDQVLPAMVGYFAGMLYNQNNVAAEASPVTTGLEIGWETTSAKCWATRFHPEPGDPRRESAPLATRKARALGAHYLRRLSSKH